MSREALRSPSRACGRTVGEDNVSMRLRDTCPGRRRRTACCVVIAAAQLICVAGCAGPRPSSSKFALRRLPQADAAEVFRVAEAALLECGFQIRSAIPSEGRVNTFPLSAEGLAEGIRAELAPVAPEARRVATLHVKPGNEEVSVFCRVDLQQPSSDVLELQFASHDLSDIPSDTPIDRDAATTAEQNTLWRNVGRDRALERLLLARIIETSGRGVEAPDAR